MNFRDRAVFRIRRNEAGDCMLELRRHILWIFPFWFSLFICPIHFSECLDFIKEWCCERDIGTAIIYDPMGVNPKMIVNYRRYKGERLNKNYE